MLQSGYSADFILGMAVESLNGVRNRSTSAGAVRDADPDFIARWTCYVKCKPPGVRDARRGGQGQRLTGVVFFRRDDVPPDIAAKGQKSGGC